MPPNGLTVLLVDDDASAARTLARLLREDGYTVELAFDGAAAIARLGRDPCPDILVVDYMLPHIDGIAVATYARSRSCAIPVLIVTSYGEVVSRRRSNLNPPPVIVPKPLSYSDLVGELARAIPA